MHQHAIYSKIHSIIGNNIQTTDVALLTFCQLARSDGTRPLRGFLLKSLNQISPTKERA